jgi:hypothetical protein
VPQTFKFKSFGFQKHVLDFKSFWPKQVLKFKSFGFQKHMLDFKSFWPKQVLKFKSFGQIRSSISHLSATDTYLSYLFTTNFVLKCNLGGATSTLGVPHIPEQFDLQSTQIINCTVLMVPLSFYFPLSVAFFTLILWKI